MLDRVNVVDAAVIAHDDNTPSRSWDGDAMRGEVKAGVRRYCPSCYGHGCLKPIEHPKFKYQCARCDSKVERYVLLKPRGSSVSETRMRRARTMEDGQDAFETAKLCKIVANCVEGVRNWFFYAHMVQEREARQNYQRKIFTTVVADISNRLPPMRLDESLQYFTLINLMVESKVPGATEPKRADLARAIGVERSQFYSGRKWCLVYELIEAVLDAFDRRLTRALVEGMGDI